MPGGPGPSQPSAAGRIPAVNPLPAVALADGATNAVPWFIVSNGPIREARFVSDGGVNDLFVVTTRSDAAGCQIAQPSFAPAGNGFTGQGGNPNIVYRIPTPLLGAGLIEGIPDSAILANARADAFTKRLFGVSGHPNRSGNDGTITRFGWKAQNKSLLLFSAEAYNVEMGISNLIFPHERDETPACQGLGNMTPNDTATFGALTPPNSAVLSDMEGFADFMRMLGPPVPGQPTVSTQHGAAVFTAVGCGLCPSPGLGPRPAIAARGADTPSLAPSQPPAPP